SDTFADTTDRHCPLQTTVQLITVDSTTTPTSPSVSSHSSSTPHLITCATTPRSNGQPSIPDASLKDVDLLGTASGLTDTQKIWTSIRYTDLEESEGWKLLPEATAAPAAWAAFVIAVKALYSGCEGANCCCQAVLQYLVQEYRTKPMCTLVDLGEYKQKFLKVSQFLINGRFLSELDRNTFFPNGLPANLKTQV
ncbi:hypothetical protein OG21DRAFT_1490503, partial [Imleria badia]